MNNNKQVYVDAVKSDFLENRSTINKKFAISDFDSWVESIINKIKFSNVLDICCGTGNQLILYVKKRETLTLTGVDISHDSLDVAHSRSIDNVLRLSSFRGNSVGCNYAEAFMLLRKID